MADHLRPPRPGEAIEARPLRRFLERCNALAKLRVTGSVGPDRMDAKLSGTGAPYTCTEQAGTASGNWADRAGGRVVPCYELNAQTGLAGQVVPAWRDAAGVWRFEYARAGTGCTGTLSFTVKGCGGLALPGATVTAYDGPDNTYPVLGTGTTDSAGHWTVAITVAKTYAYRVEAAPRFDPATGTVAATCTTNAVVVTLSPATGYVCCPTLGGVQAIAKRLYMTTPYGLVTLDWTTAIPGTVAATGWVGCLDSALPSTYGYAPAGYSCIASAVTCALRYHLHCSGIGPNAYPSAPDLVWLGGHLAVWSENCGASSQHPTTSTCSNTISYTDAQLQAADGNGSGDTFVNTPAVAWTLAPNFGPWASGTTLPVSE